MASEAPPLSIPPPAMSTLNVFPDEDENEDEWEYEYSATEYETYYVTLDLTTPHVPPKRRARKPPDRRAGRWTNPGLGKQKRHTLPPPPTFSASQPGFHDGAPDQAHDPNIDVEEPFQDEDEGADEAPAIENGGTAVAERPNKVQILDLHSNNPIVSYDGHVYSCRWAENIGTELLFKSHNVKDPLPGIRTLPDDVDLIAMSSARIVSQSVQIKPNLDVIPQSSKRQYGRIKNLKIPVGTGASMKRKQQAAFLERLMAVKEKKGEQDLVTVLTKTRPSNAKWLEALRDKRNKERQKIKSIIKNGNPTDETVQSAQARLTELDAEEERRTANLEARGLRLDGKRKAKEDDARKRVKTADDSAPPKTRRGPKRGRPRKITLQAELHDLLDERPRAESLMVENDHGQTPSVYEDMESPGTDIGDADPYSDEDEDAEMFDN